MKLEITDNIFQVIAIAIMVKYVVTAFLETMSKKSPYYSTEGRNLRDQ
jgi:hypothetical protein